MIDPERLEQINEQLQREGVPHHQRPMRAISLLSKELGLRIDHTSDSEKEIYRWFKKRIKPGADEIDSVFRSVFFYDAAFWTVNVPIVYGRVEAGPPTLYLTDMPEAIKDSMNRHAGEEYTIFWATCMDYGLGFFDLKNSSNLSLNIFGMDLLRAADKHLRSAVSLLTEYPPNPSAIHTCRMATEIFMKAYLAIKDGLTEKDAKRIDHDLVKGFERFRVAAGLTNWQDLESKITAFPDINERYTSQEVPPDMLWQGFAVTQSIAAAIIREFAGRRVKFE